MLCCNYIATYTCIYTKILAAFCCAWISMYTCYVHVLYCIHILYCMSMVHAIHIQYYIIHVILYTYGMITYVYYIRINANTLVNNVSKFSATSDHNSMHALVITIQFRMFSKIQSHNQEIPPILCYNYSVYLCFTYINQRLMITIICALLIKL